MHTRKRHIEDQNSHGDFLALMAQLELLHAGEIKHIRSSLIEHLEGTYKLLNDWYAHASLCKAGLFHAVYSTSGFDQALETENNRDQIKSIIGEAAEKIVYIYCATDRDYFFPQIGRDENPLFLNRFTADKCHLSSDELRDFCELTVANELEIAKDNPEFVQQYGAGLKALFYRMKPYISSYAYDHFIKILG